MSLEFEWDDDKAKRNVKKHGGLLCRKVRGSSAVAGFRPEGAAGCSHGRKPVVRSISKGVKPRRGLGSWTQAPKRPSRK